MARSLTIAAYLAGLGANERPVGSMAQPDRPPGVVIWARCSHPDQLTAIRTLGRKVSEDGDPIHIIATLRDRHKVPNAKALPEPVGKDGIRAFIDHWKPAMTIWVRGDLDTILLQELHAANMHCILVDANGEGLEAVAGGWVPGAMRSLLSQFEAVLALDGNAADRLVRAGAPQDVVLVMGAMEDCEPALPCDDTERQEFTDAIGTRPVWLAAAAQLNDSKDIARAHRKASHRTHRLLLVIVPANPDEAIEFARRMRAEGFHVKRRSREEQPNEPTQVYIIDTEEELGLWYRVAPITYLGGTLHGGGCRDPFEATSLGSAVLYGPQVAPYQRHAARLNAAGASRLLRSGNDLGPAVEYLLSADKTAELAHAGWDVTSRGADVTNRIAAYLQNRLEELGH